MARIGHPQGRAARSAADAASAAGPRGCPGLGVRQDDRSDGTGQANQRQRLGVSPVRGRRAARRPADAGGFTPSLEGTVMNEPHPVIPRYRRSGAVAAVPARPRSLAGTR
ncbi:hypothetical protein ATKI12_4508 [Kitasatospora sp. Ki12]